MDNTVGSINIKNLLSTSKGAYILGLFCSDGYQRTSSIGISNSSEDLLIIFADFLLNYFPRERLRIRAYYPYLSKSFSLSQKLKRVTNNIVYYPSVKAKKIACHLYVNSRPLLRLFNEAKESIDCVNKKVIPSYLAGRFDGDGSVNKYKNRDFRFIYSNKKEAEIDKIHLKKIGINNSSIYRYQFANTYCLYVWRGEIEKLINKLIPYSVYLQMRKNIYTP